jgi:isopenicillin N synthase-like dioxygenase
MQKFQQLYQPADQTSSSTISSSSSSSSSAAASEPSALQGILSERFLCGPDLTAAQQQDPYYSSELGQVFFPPNIWPSNHVPALQPQMLQCYSQCETIAAALMRLFAVALGVQQQYFDDKLHRHHSNMQVHGTQVWCSCTTYQCK